MAIKYKLYQDNRSNRDDKGKWFARVFCDETLDTNDLAQHMADHHSPYTFGTIAGVLRDMTRCIRELVMNSKAVKLDDLAIFRPSVTSTGAEAFNKFNAKENVINVRLIARGTGIFASKELKKATIKELEPYNVKEQQEMPPKGA